MAENTNGQFYNKFYYNAYIIIKSNNCLICFYVDDQQTMDFFSMAQNQEEVAKQPVDSQDFDPLSAFMFNQEDQNTNGQDPNDLLQDQQNYEDTFEKPKEEPNDDFLMSLIDNKPEEPQESNFDPLSNENNLGQGIPSVNENKDSMFSIEDLLSTSEQPKTIQNNENSIPDEAQLPEVPNEINVAVSRQQDYEIPK